MVNRILLVDDDPLVLASLKRTLHGEPLVIDTALSAEEALDTMRQQSFKVIVSDERMAGMQGAEFLATVRRLYPATLRMVLTGYATMELAMKAVNEGEICRLFMKPWDGEQLREAIRSAIERYDLEEVTRRMLDRAVLDGVAISALEKQHPGLTRIQKDRDGAFVLQDLPEDEIRAMLSEYGQFATPR